MFCDDVGEVKVEVDEKDVENHKKD